MHKYIILLLATSILFSCRKALDPFGAYGNQVPAAPNYREVVRVQFKDKGSSAQLQPQEYLSQEAINRRQRQGISINQQDLPVATEYIDSCLQRSQGRVLHQSKWLNYIVLHLPEGVSAERLEELSFIESIEKLGEFKNYRHPLFPEQPAEQQNWKPVNLDTLLFSEANYDQTYDLFQRHEAGILHERKFYGKGKRIGIIDIGFAFMHENAALTHLSANAQIKASYDFLMQSPEVSAGTSRGNYNLGIMAALNPGTYIGMAPQADYVLLIADAVGVQEPLFETAWIAALEYADSCGVDIISSYSTFGTLYDNPIYNIDQSKSDGTALCSQAADIAFEKGILIFQSINSASSAAERFVIPPADARNIMTVGNLRENGGAAWSSLDMPTADGRIKPELAALVENVPVIYGWGGSWSHAHASSILAGLTACLWQGLPEKSAAEIREILIQASSNYPHADSKLGYGITNYKQALLDNL